MFQIIFLRAHSASRFRSRHRFSVGKVVALGARMAPLLKVSKVLQNQPLLLSGYGPVPCLHHQVQHPFAVFVFTAMVMEQMLLELGFRDEPRVAELANHRWGQDGLIIERAQLIACDLVTGNVAGLCRPCLQRMLDTVRAPV